MTLAIASPNQVLQEMPLNPSHEAFVKRSRGTIENILEGKDQRFLLIVGPCSIHDVESTLEYAEKLKKLANEVEDKFFIVMRTYFEKPRTSKGWKGLLYDPHLDGSYAMEEGLRIARKILVTLAQNQLPAGSELLEITTAHYLSDLLSWGCIGARTCTSQPHRQLASSLNLPIGFKNTTDGNVINAINGIISASSSHIFLGLQKNGELSRIQTGGNPYCHVVLRGGDKKPNFDEASIFDAIKLCHDAKVSDKILIDCSHGNCGKKHRQQIPVFESVISSGAPIMGSMIESHLKEGSQPLSQGIEYGVSITDPCLDWLSTEFLIKSAYSKLTLRKK